MTGVYSVFISIPIKSLNILLSLAEDKEMTGVECYLEKDWYPA